MNLKKKLRILLGSLAVFVLGIALAGCSTAKTATTAKNKVIHITYWHVNAQTQGGTAVNALVKEFNKTHKNIKVTAKYNPNMYQGLMQNLQSAQASGKVPDIVQVGWSYTNYFADNFKYLTPQQASKDFDGNDNFIKNNFSTRTLSFAKNSQGKLVGLPYSLSTPILYVNKTMLDKYQIKTSELATWQGVATAARKIKQQSGNYGLYIQQPADTWAQQALMLSNGAQIEKNGKAAFASRKGIAAYQLYQNLIKENVAINTPWAQGIDDFVNGKVAMAFTTVAQASHIKQSVNFTAISVEAPHFKNEKTVVPVGGSMLAITAQKTAQQKAAWVFEKYMYQNSSLLTWSKGTGYLPPTKEAFNSAQFKTYLKANPMLKPAAKLIDKAVAWTSFPKNGLQAEQTMIDARDKILSGSNVASTLKKAQETINEQQ
ncbi:ABC transporter substrate-binding protein [Ligilactobacillus sp. WILCCON 0076]|uniref:ABC transporter substrate-binding protein n=1 Tax=Ligilactobacillus ubinensis TaxID=2876789 RepID=A0A9X2JPD7_9LACO|nr:ABC transporter substrate-binding protein [Ligilactobacillus ubinensis]MCP0887836.1 ABC transporter substrate-binding protein [Ligilactobacillus ubinensis]